MTDTETKIPPYDLDSEEAVLGSLLIDAEAIYKMVDVLLPEDFYREKNRWTYEACVELSKRQEGINTITVAHEMARGQKLEAAGGAAYLSHLVTQVPTSVHAGYYAGIVKRLSTYRRMISASNQIAGIAYSSPPDSEEAINKAEATLVNLRDGHKDDLIISHEDGIALYDKRMQELESNPPMPIKTGWPSLDDKLRIRPGTVATIGAYSSFGKTIMGENIAESAAKQGFKVVYFLCELTLQHMMNRRACRYMELDNGNGLKIAPRMHDLEDGRYIGHPALYSCFTEWLDWAGKITFVESSGWSLPKICATIRQLGQKGLADIIVIDYLQLIPIPEMKGFTPAQMVGEIVKILKITVNQMQNKPPLILMSQLNSEGRIRNSNEPMEYSNIVIFIENLWKMTKGKCIASCPEGRVGSVGCWDGCVDLVIEKNTFGATDRIKLRHDKPRYRFYERTI